MRSKLNWLGILVVGVLILVGLEIISLLISVFSSLGPFDSFRVVFGSIFVLFLPGFVWTFVFFSNKGEKKVDLIERVALSFALSIAIVPLVVFYLNLIGLKISAWSSFIVVLLIVLIGAGVIWWRRKKYAKP